VGNGLDRRTFVRGATGAVGIGAVGAMSSKLQSAKIVGEEDTSMSLATVEIVEIDVWLRGNRLMVAEEEARRNDRVDWKPEEGLKVLHIQWKEAQTPFRLVDLPEPALRAPANRAVRGDAQLKRYYYTIVAADEERTYLLDPPLDIVP
jgi:hypothetical protein